MTKDLKILVTGGAGYIGSVLVRILLNAGYKVRVLDSLRSGGDSLVDILGNPRFEFIKGDVREPADVKAAVEGCYAVAHLAAIVGDPACKKEPDLARSINLGGGKLLWEASLPYSGDATPATYSVGGKQFVVIHTSNARTPRDLKGSGYVAFALP